MKIKQSKICAALGILGLTVCAAILPAFAYEGDEDGTGLLGGAIQYFELLIVFSIFYYAYNAFRWLAQRGRELRERREHDDDPLLREALTPPGPKEPTERADDFSAPLPGRALDYHAILTEVRAEESAREQSAQQ
jgi:hypothetical protein